jgi:ABC-type multidrug transport system fused ATPase/permease subunit
MDIRAVNLVINILIVFFVLSAVISFFTPRATVEWIKNRLTDYWLFVQELPIKDELSSHVRIVRRFLKQNAALLLIAVIVNFFVLSAVSSALTYYYAVKNPAVFVEENFAEQFLVGTIKNKAEGEIRAALQKAFFEHDDSVDRHYDDDDDDDEKSHKPISELWLVDLQDDSPFGVKDTACDNTPKDQYCQILAASVALAREKQSKLLTRIESMKANETAEVAHHIAVSNAKILFFHSFIYSVALIISVLVTLRLLRAMERIRLASILFVVVDVALAFAIPVIALLLVLLMLTRISDYGFNALFTDPEAPEYARNVIWYVAKWSSFFSAYPVVLFKNYAHLYLSIDLSQDYLKGLLLWLSLPLDWAKYELRDFYRDIVLAATGHMREIGPLRTQRNWMVGSSVGFSIIYIVSVLFLILTKRYVIFREGVAKVLQHLIENEKGPIAAFSLFFAFLLGVVKASI